MPVSHLHQACKITSIQRGGTILIQYEFYKVRHFQNPHVPNNNSTWYLTKLQIAVTTADSLKNEKEFLMVVSIILPAPSTQFVLCWNGAEKENKHKVFGSPFKILKLQFQYLSYAKEASSCFCEINSFWLNWSLLQLAQSSTSSNHPKDISEMNQPHSYSQVIWNGSCCLCAVFYWP